MISLDYTTRVYMDYSICYGDKVAVLAVYERSQQMVQSFCAKISINDISFEHQGKKFFCNGKYKAYSTPVNCGKEKIYHAVLMSEQIGKELFITTAENRSVDFYNYLMENYELPLLQRWGAELFDSGIEKKIIDPKKLSAKVYIGEFSSLDFSADYNYKNELDKIEIHDMLLYGAAELEQQIKELFQKKKIWISEQEQAEIKVKDMDEYFKEYGHTLVDNLKNKTRPLSELNGNIDSFALKSMRLYPQQAAMVNGACALLNGYSNYALLIEGMGVGKTIQAISIGENYAVRKWLFHNPGKGLEDAYMDPTSIKYRNIVMCPGHMVEKWAEEIKSQLPYAIVHKLQSFSQLVALRKEGPERNSREYYVMSKEFAKLNYMLQPVPTQMKHNKKYRKKICSRCGEDYMAAGRICPKCRNRGFQLGDIIDKASGLICPECGELLIYKNTGSDEERFRALLPEDFATPSLKNQNCFYCGTNLWQPFVRNIDCMSITRGTRRQPSMWIRATHYANKTRKMTKSVWVHRKYYEEYFDKVDEKPLTMKSKLQGVRKYSPAQFIKKYMKRYFDFAIFDEAQDYKGGTTGQGNAMDALIKSSKKQLVLTGTIAGGMADHLFYLLYRLEPKRMVDAGFGWNDVMKFAEQYGCVERCYELCSDTDADTQLSTTVRGKQLGSVRSKPGISPRIFTDFLLDRAVFLDLNDMSQYLPPLKEIVVSVPMADSEQRMYQDYERVLNAIKKEEREKKRNDLFGKKIQFSLSYLDKPFGEREIINPHDGDVVCAIPQHPELYDGVMSKERKLLEIVGKELLEGRCCVIYAEYTASPDTCITQRLQMLISKEFRIKTVILESASPEPLKREAWIHDQAEKGAKVIITNPRCVQTGLDFCWQKKDVWYNYPTLIFYQLGNSLFTVWQASRRAYRLIQREECRIYYMAYEGTIQMSVIGLIAEKQVATSAIQGKFSTEGIAAMASGVDDRVKMMAALSQNDYTTKDEIQGMFDVLADARESEKEDYGEYIPMKTFIELIGKEAAERQERQFFDVPDIDTWLQELLEDMEEPSQQPEVKKQIVSPEGINNVVGNGKKVDIFSLF